RSAAFAAGMDIAGPKPDEDRPDEKRKRDHAVALRLLRMAVRAKDPAVRLLAAGELDAGDDAAAGELLLGLFADRDVETRVAAVTQYAKRVIHKGARVEPLLEVLRKGARELMLPAAEGAAARGHKEALRPLLLFVRAGEEGERERALLGLGTLGDARALEE